MAHEDTPPAFEGPNIVNLDAQRDSKISSVSLYPGRAEVTRTFRFSVRTGHNQVVIKSLPALLERETLRYLIRDTHVLYYATDASAVLTDMAMQLSKE